MRAFTIILLILFFVTAAFLIFLSDESGLFQTDAPSVSPQETVAIEETVFTLSEVPPESEIQETLEGEVIFPPEDEAPEFLQKEASVEKTVFALNEVTAKPGHSKIPGTGREKPKKLNYNFGVEDATGQGDVRASNLKVGVDYKLSKNSTVSVEASQGIHDSKDAAAWGKSVDDETAAQAKYKIAF